MRCYTETENGRVYVRPGNLPRHTAATLGVSAVNIRATGWLTLSATASGIYNRYLFADGSGIGPVSRLMPMADLKCLMHLPHGWSAELSGSYAGRMAYGQAVVHASGKVYAGVRRSLPREAGSVTLFVNDPFDTARRRSTIMLPHGKRASMTEREAEDMRRIGVTLMLKFKSGKVSGNAGRPKDLPDEIKRVNLQ